MCTYCSSLMLPFSACSMLPNAQPRVFFATRARRFTHAKSDMPSGFSMKLRKHIRTQRLEDVRQVGMDRVVDFKFGSGEASNHVILELYASGESCVYWGRWSIDCEEWNGVTRTSSAAAYAPFWVGFCR